MFWNSRGTLKRRAKRRALLLLLTTLRLPAALVVPLHRRPTGWTVPLAMRRGDEEPRAGTAGDLARAGVRQGIRSTGRGLLAVLGGGGLWLVATAGHSEPSRISSGSYGTFEWLP